MFWVVVASGFYCYAFYDTGVDKTFASVERLTHVQWYAGGIMRSLHRYAADVLVIALGLVAALGYQPQSIVVPPRSAPRRPVPARRARRLATLP